VWKARQVPNPGYYEDVATYDDLAFVGFEVCVHAALLLIFLNAGWFSSGLLTTAPSLTTFLSQTTLPTPCRYALVCMMAVDSYADNAVAARRSVVESDFRG
jgi:hypothetical protein